MFNTIQEPSHLFFFFFLRKLQIIYNVVTKSILIPSQVYNEKIFDLLTVSRSESLDVRQAPDGVFVENLTEELVDTVAAVESVYTFPFSPRY